MEIHSRFRGLTLLITLASIATGSNLHAQETSRGPGEGSRPAATDALYKRQRAVVVGIDSYARGDLLPALGYAEADAVAVGDLLQSRFGFEVVRILGAEATKARILTALEESAQLGPEDAFLFFFAGHGETSAPATDGRRAGFLVPYDAEVSLAAPGDRRMLEEWCVNMQEVSARLATKNVGHSLLVLDCCFSGLAAADQMRGPGDGDRRLLLEPSLLALTAGEADERSLESSELRNSYFTSALLEILSQATREISAKGLLPSLRERVAARTGGRQRPRLLRLASGTDGDFYFVPREVADGKSLVARVRRRQEIEQRAQVDRAELFAVAEALPYARSSDPLGPRAEWEGRFRRLQDQALAGDPLAKACLFYCYWRGLGTEPSDREAYLWALRGFEESREPAALHVLAEAYRLGIGVEPNRAAARRFWDEALRGGCALTQLQAARELSASADARTVERTDALLEAAAAQGYAAAVVERARRRLVAGSLSLAERADALEAIGAAAEGGLSSAGLAYFDLVMERPRRATKEQLERARALLVRAAEAGLPAAQGKLAWCLVQNGDWQASGWASHGYGFTKDLEAGRAWGEAAAAQGDLGGHLALLVLHAREGSAAFDPAAAKTHVEAGVRAGDPVFLALRALFTFQGNFYPKDDRTALQHAQPAAKQGNSLACYLMGVLESFGASEAPRPDPSTLEGHSSRRQDRLARALPWWVRGAEAGNLSCMGAIDAERTGFELSQVLDRRELEGVKERLKTLWSDCLRAAAPHAYSWERLSKSWGPLHFAARFDFVEIASDHIERGADLDAQTDVGGRPLHMARSEAMAEVLLRAGASPNVAAKDGATPLHSACSSGNVDVARALLAAGADTTLRNARGQTPLDAARASDRDEVVALLEARPDAASNPAATDRAGRTALHRAVEAGDAAGVRRAIAGGVPLDAKDSLGRTALRNGLQRAAWEIAAILVDAGADVRDADKSGETPILAAVKQDSAENALGLLRRMLELHASPTAAKAPQPAPNEALRPAGAPPASPRLQGILDRLDPSGARPRSGETPLGQAVHRVTGCSNTAHRHIDVVALLVEFGADPLVPLPDLRDRSAIRRLLDADRKSDADRLLALVSDERLRGRLDLLCRAMELGHEPLVARICALGGLQSGAGGDEDPLALAVSKGRLDWTRALLDAGVHPEGSGRKGIPVWMAVTSAPDESRLELLRLLVDRGARADRDMGDGWTPLLFAMQSKQDDVVGFLIEKRAGLEMRDSKTGHSTLHLAVLMQRPGWVRTLLDAGVPVNVQNAEGLTPLHCAATVGSVECFAALAAAGADATLRDKEGKTAIERAYDPRKRVEMERILGGRSTPPKR